MGERGTPSGGPPMRLNASTRSLIADAIQRDIKISRICEVFDVTRKTVRKWSKRKRFNDKKRKPKESKIIFEVEYSILALRKSFDWGTARIQQGLKSLPSFILNTIPDLVQGITLSRQAINSVLKKHKLNGYKNKKKTWKFFRAKKPNELWQIDFKEYVLYGKKQYFLVMIDDHSRFLLLFKHFDHCPSTKEVCEAIKPLVDKHKPESILADNGSQFRKKWKKFLKWNGVKPLSAHPYYPQDKGKVERAIRNLAEEFIHLIKKWPEWINNILDYLMWYNFKRYHRGIQGHPANVYLET